MKPILDEILLQIGQLVRFDSAAIFLVKEDVVRAVASKRLPNSEQLAQQTFPIDSPLVVRILAGRTPLVLEDTSRDPGFEAWGGSGDVSGWMGIPLVTDKANIGFINLGRGGEQPFTADEAEIAQAFANQAAMTIENARLFDEAQTLLEQTRRQADQLEQVMDVIPDGVLLLDNEQRVIRANGAGRAYLSQLSDVQVGQRLARFGRVPLEELTRAGTLGTSWHELISVEPYGVFEASAKPIGEPGQHGGWLVVLRNVTAKRKQEGYLRAQERLATVGQLAAGIAHDFNNTMAIISLYTQLVMRTSGLGDNDRQRLNIIQGQAQRASELIRQILDFSRQSVVEKKPIDFLPFVKESVRTLGQGLPDKIKLETVFEQEEYLTLGDSGRLLQVISNLATNAVEAMPEGGRLLFSLSRLDLAAGERFPLPDMTAGRWIRLTVQDDGQGIPTGDLDRVFEPFYTTKAVGAGTGLGLAQVYGIVKLHEGFISVDSQVDRGTAFNIYLPAFKPQEKEPAQAGDDAKYSGSGEMILIVEDDKATREALAEYLTALNYSVITAGNGRDALQIFGELQADIQLVLTDMVMPVMDGATLFSRLKQTGTGVKLIAITGYPLDTGIIELLERETVSFIQKPLRVEEVARAIKEALSEVDD